MMVKIIAFDIGGTSMRAALVQNKKILKYKKINTPKTKKDFLLAAEKLTKELITKDTIGIGIGIAGTVRKGIIENAPNLTIKNFNIKKHFEKKFKIKTEVENDANCVAIAEAKMGCKKKNFIVITLGTGIGGGIIINERLYRGAGYASEFGHTWINGKEWEDSWKKTKRKIKEKYKTEYLSKVAKLKDKKAKKIVNEAADYLGQGIASLTNSFDPEIIILAGGVKESKEEFLSPIKKALKKYSFFKKPTKISWSKLKHPGILGASLLINQ